MEKVEKKKDYEIFIKVDRRKETVKTPTYINQIRSKKRSIKMTGNIKKI